METSSATTASSTHIEVMRKAMQVQEQQVLKILESQSEQNKASGAALLGVGTKLDIKS